jgi:formylglycine-generating enzyme required for sulfatase activity
MTFTAIPGPVDFLMGSPPTEAGRIDNEARHRRRIPRSYAVATKAATVAQWKQFLKERPQVAGHHAAQYSPEENCPINGVSWYTAAEYCNWLSEKEGIPRGQWCYPEKIGEGMRMTAGYLKRTGYRLLTEAEWEYACRAGAATSRCYGSSLDLLPRYAFYLGNSRERSWPVGQKRPNDLGLFDLHGGMWTWCQGPFVFYPEGVLMEDKEDVRDIKDLQDRKDLHFRLLLRGGSFSDRAAAVRSAFRMTERPGNSFVILGVRVARTYD